MTIPLYDIVLQLDFGQNFDLVTLKYGVSSLSDILFLPDQCFPTRSLGTYIH